MKGIIQSKNIKCIKCGSLLYIDYTTRLLSNPPQHKIFCKECGRCGSMTIRGIMEKDG